MVSSSPMRLEPGELRAITGWAALCAREVLDLFEADQPGDARPREASEAAQRYAAGARRDAALRARAWAARTAARQASALAAAEAALAASAAAGRTRRAGLLTSLDAQLRR